MIYGAEGLTPNEFKEQLRWLARDVMPASGGPQVHTRAAECGGGASLDRAHGRDRFAYVECGGRNECAGRSALRQPLFLGVLNDVFNCPALLQYLEAIAR